MTWKLFEFTSAERIADDRANMILQLTRNELEWLAGNMDADNLELAALFFAEGGFHAKTDAELADLMNRMEA